MNAVDNSPARRRATFADLRRRISGALRIAIIYTVVSGVWILLSDRVVVEFITDPAGQVTANTLKGWGFVVFTAVLIYGLVREHTSELRAGEERYRTLVEQASDGILVSDPGGICVEVNTAAGEMLGYAREDIVGKRLTDFILADGVTTTPLNATQLQRGETTLAQLRLKRSDGSPLPVEVSARLLPDGRLQGIVRDITARQRAEAERFRLMRVLDSSLNEIYLFDSASLRFTYVNQGARQNLGYSLDELRLLTPVELKPEFTEETFRSLIAPLLQHERAVHVFETVHRRKNGTLYPVEVHLQLMETEGTSLFVAIIHDITARKQAEAILAARDAELRQRNEELARLYRASGALISDSSWTLTELARQVVAIVQQEFGQANCSVFLRQPDSDAIDRLAVAGPYAPAVRGKAFSLDDPGLVPQVLRTGRLMNAPDVHDIPYYVPNWPDARSELTIPLSVGTHTIGAIDIQSAQRAAFSADDERLMAIFAERAALAIAQKQAESQREAALDALRASEQRYRILFENNPHPMWVYDLDTLRFLAVNEAAIKHYGYTRDEFLAMTIKDIRPPEDVPDLLDDVAHTTTPLYRAGIWRHRLKDGALIDVEVVSHLLTFGDQIARLVLANDVTRRVQAEEKILQLNQELEQRVIERTAQLEAANKELESFSYSVSHDLRAPLRAIDGFSRLLLRDASAELTPENQHYLELIRKNTQQMSTLIEALLNFSRLGRKPLEVQAVDMTHLAQQALDDLRGDLGDREVEIHLDDLCPCQGDPKLLLQVWTNLLSNAFKYTRASHPAKIEVGCQQPDGARVYYVKDNGVGFDMQYAHKLFGVFQRLHRVEDYEGNGVGLALVQRIVNRHGGRVWAQAAVGQGATFFFTVKS
jgi:PAS domain S-box-containing protein